MDSKKIRTKLYLTQEKFAEAIGVHINTVRAWEQGINNISLTMQGRIAKLCKQNGITIEE